MAFLLGGLCLVSTAAAQGEWYLSYKAYNTIFANQNMYILDGIEDEHGYLWFASNEGLLRYDGYDEVLFRPVPGDTNSLSASHLTSLTKLNDTLLVAGTFSGNIEVFNTRTFKSRSIPVFEEERYVGPIYTIRNVIADNSGILWVAAQMGMYKVDPFSGVVTQFQPYPSTERIRNWTIDPNLTWDIQVSEFDSNILYVAGQDGFFQFDLTTEQFISRNQTFTPVNSLLQDSLRGRIYMGCYLDGMAYYDVRKDTIRHIPGGEDRLRTTSMYLLNDTTAFLYRSDEGFGTMNLNDLQIYFSKDTLVNPYLTQKFQALARHGFVDANNRQWVSTKYHHWLFQLDSIPTHRTPPLAINSLRTVDGNVFQSFPHHSFRLPDGQNTLSLTLGAINPLYPEQVSYAYRLNKGKWIDLGNSRQITLSDLAHGSHTISIRASDPNSFGTIEDTVFTMTTEIPLIERLWFRVLGLTFLLLILSTTFFIYLKALRANARYEESQRQMVELELKALRSQMNPHFMFNSLNSIKNYILRAEPRIAAEYLSNFAHLIRMILQNSSSRFISLQDEVETLILYIDLEKLRFDDEFEFNCIIDEHLNLEAIMIPPMILQPYVENAIWHGLMHKQTPGQLTLQFKKDTDHVLCIVEDNGVGRQAAAKLKERSIRKYKSMGMGITSDRIDIMNRMDSLGITTTLQDLEHNGEPAGTRVTVRIPESHIQDFTND